MIRVESQVIDYAHSKENDPKVISVMSNDKGDDLVIIRYGDGPEDYVEVNAHDMRCAISNALAIMFDPRSVRPYSGRYKFGDGRYVSDEG